MNYNAEFIDSIGKIIVFLMVFFSVFLLIVKREKPLSNWLLALFLLITALDMTGLIIIKGIAEYPSFLALKASSSLLQMPVFYFYVLSVCYSDFKIKPIHILHSALFFLFLIVFNVTAMSDQSIVFYLKVGEIQYWAYIIAIFLVLKKYKTVYLENYSNPDYTTHKWLFQVTVIFCIGHVFVLLRMVGAHLQIGQYLLFNINIIISISALFIVCRFVLKALLMPQIFTGIKTDIEPIDRDIDKLKNKDITVNNEAIKMLEFYMEKEKPYLDSELTLQKLSAQINISEKELSILINHHLNKHFFDFINEFRIKEAKAILESANQSELTILEILYQVGFNSKSSFYTAFKKIAHQTPKEYRNEALKKIPA